MSNARQVQPPEPGKRTSKLVDPAHETVTVATMSASKDCYWNDKMLAQGTSIHTVEGETYTCVFGYWELQHESGEGA